MSILQKQNGRQVAAYPIDWSISNACTKREAILPKTIPTGPAGMENDSVDAIEGKRPMILKPKANIWTVE